MTRKGIKKNIREKKE